MVSDEMPHLARDLLLAIPIAKDGPEKRGLVWLKLLAENCADREGSSLV